MDSSYVDLFVDLFVDSVESAFVLWNVCSGTRLG